MLALLPATPDGIKQPNGSTHLRINFSGETFALLSTLFFLQSSTEKHRCIELLQLNSEICKTYKRTV